MKKFQRCNELNGDTFGRELSPLAVNQGVVINRDRSLGYGFLLEPPYTCLLSDEALAGSFQTLAGFLNALPEHFDVQVIWTQNSRSEEFRRRLLDREYSAGLVGEVQREQDESVLGLLGARRLRWIEVYLILVRKLPEPAVKRAGKSGPRSLRERVETFFTGVRDQFQYTVEQFAAASSELLTQSRTLAAAIEPLGWNPTPLDDDGVARLFYQRWNPRQFEEGGCPRPAIDARGIPLSERFVHSSFRWDPSGAGVPAGMAELDGWFHAILSLYEPPEELGRPAFDQFLLLGEQGRAEMVINAERGDRQKRIQRLRTLLRQRQADGQTANDPAEKAATLQLTEELEEMGANSEGTWRAACYLHLWAATESELREQIAVAISQGRANDAVFIEEKRALWPYWRAMQPFWTQDKDRYRLLDYSTRQLVRILPLFGQPTNLSPKKAIGVLYQTASRSIFNWVVPDENLFANPHHLVVGGTGSGKSVLADEILIAMRRRRAKVVIIDLGGSFANFCHSSGGNYIDYNLKSRANRINPLWLPPGTVPDPEILRSRALWLESLVRERKERLSAEELLVLEEALRRAYFRDLQQPLILRQVRTALLQDERGAALARRLALWCEDGSFSNLFDGPTQIDLSAPVIVFDLKRVVHDQRDADLSRVIFNSIVSTVASLSLEPSPDPKFLVFDEAGIMLKDEATAEFMEYCFRTLRKAGVSVGAISQGLEDFLGNRQARNAFVGAADNIFVLKQDNYDKARLIAEEKTLSVQELNCIQAVNTVPGSHAEFILVQKTPHGQRSLHLLSVSTPLKYAFTANSPEDRRVIREYEASGMARPDAIRRFAREHPAGIASSRVVVALVLLFAIFTGCARSTSPVAAGKPENADLAEAMAAARRDERQRIMREYWFQHTVAADPKRTDDTRLPLLLYPAGRYDGLNFSAREAADPSLGEPAR